MSKVKMGVVVLALVVLMASLAIAVPAGANDVHKASFVASATTGYAPITITFTDKSVGAGSWYWDFSDGSNSTEQSPSHKYYNPGGYLASLTINKGTPTESKASVYIYLTMYDYCWVTANSYPKTMDKSTTGTLTFTIKNTGGSTWNKDTYKLTGLFNASKFGVTTVSLTSDVAPGASATFSVPVTAPSAPGFHRVVLQMTNAAGKLFGQAVFDTITVKETAK